MNLYSKVFLFLFLCSLINCSNYNRRIIVDELFISKHSVGPQMNDTTFYYDGLRIHRNKFKITEPCRRGFKTSHSSYHPRLIININSSGRLLGYLRNCPNEGYVNLILNDSLISNINNQLQKITYKDLDTVYSGSGEGFTEYFISIKNGNEEKQIMIMQDYQGTKLIRSLIDSLYNYINKLELSDSINVHFRKDTLIVLKTERYWDNRVPN